MKDFRFPMSAFATVARKSFKDKFTAKIDFLVEHSFADADIGNLKSLHTFFDKHSDYMLVKYSMNKIVRSEKF